MRCFRKVLLATVAVFAAALALVSPGFGKQPPDTVGGVLRGPCPDPTHPNQGTFTFHAFGETMEVTDACADGWSIVVELWYCSAPSQRTKCNGNEGLASLPKLHHTCWADRGAGVTGHCDFSIPEGTRITLFIAQAHHRSCTRKGDPSSGCKKNNKEKTDIFAIA
jgi:hypothetical protein